MSEDPAVMAWQLANEPRPAGLDEVEAEVQADCICIVYMCVCYRGRRCKLTVYV